MISQTSANTMFSFKVVLISTSVLSAAIMLKLSVPVITDFAVYEVPSIYNGVVSWLRPPYLYLLINCIIITIVASSRFQSRKDDLSPPLMPAIDAVHPQPVAPPVSAKSIQTEYPTADYTDNGEVPSDPSDYHGEVQKRLDFDAYELVEAREGTKIEQSPGTIIRAADGGAAFAKDAMSNKENEYVIGKSSWNAAEYSPSTLKPPVSARFVHRRNVKASPDGGKTVLGVSKPKRNDTLESTWKTITDGRAMPLTRHLKKSDTWEREREHVRRQEKTMSKAATFNTGDSSPGSGGSGKLRKEASLSQDELNRRVEAFIKKFNEEMRLQRQESLNQYREMINRGSH